MSLSDIQAALPALTTDERAALHEALYALDEGISVEEWRAINKDLEEELNDPSPSIPADEVFAKMVQKYPREA